MADSLRRRLILILLGLTLTTWLVSVVLTAVFAQKILHQQIERQLIQYMDMARQSVSLVLSEPKYTARNWQNLRSIHAESDATRVRGFGTQGGDQAINLWFEQSQVMVGDIAPQFPQPEKEGFITWRANAESAPQWRILYRQDRELGIWLAAGIDLTRASSVEFATLLRAILPLLVILPLSLPILLWGVQRGLRPLNQLAHKIEARKPQALDPIDTDDVPQEMRPVVIALNGLLQRLERALVSESRFTANAAHELQTPLAAIKAEVQRYQRQVKDTNTSHMLERISTRVSRATNTVTQLLTLARLDPQQEFQREQVNLNVLVMDTIAEEGGTAIDRTLDIHLTEEPAAILEGHTEWLKILIRNIIANAFRHSPASSVVEISLEIEQESVRLLVANDSEPIAKQQRAQLVERFYTLPGSAAGGAGLGLSIVKRIAELHCANMTIEEWSSERGFAIQIDFPKKRPLTK